MNDNIKLYDAKGKEIKISPIKTVSRKEVAFNVFNYHMKSDDRDTFFALLAQYVPIDENGKMEIPMDDENIQNTLIGYASTSVINRALDEDLMQAYSLLFTYTDPKKFNDDTTVMVTEDLLKELKTSHIMVPELIIAQDICEVQGEIYTTLQGLSGKQVTSFQANRIQERFEDFTPYLAPEQIAAGYYNISIIHRALLAEKDIYKPSENNQEKECLYKIIENTSDYKRIHYCINRLGSDYSDRGAVRAAYRRALSHTQSPSDLYKINKALAECYIDEYKPTVGFVTKQEENDPLLKAELHYKEALRYAGQSEKTSLIKKVAQLQLKQRRIDDWTETETEFAMKFLTGEERVHALIKIASINKQYTKEYLEFALKQTVSSRKIIKAKKKTIVSKIDYYLRPIYQRENNEEKIKYLNEVLQKFNSIKTYGNPLQRYIKDKTDRQ